MSREQIIHTNKVIYINSIVALDGGDEVLFHLCWLYVCVCAGIGAGVRL